MKNEPTLWDTPPPAQPDAFARGMEGSRQSAHRWSPVEAAEVDRAIERAARELSEFTADDVWERAPYVRITKGLAGRLNAARFRGVIASTGRVAFAQRGGTHDHGQRLAVWRSLVYREVET